MVSQAKIPARTQANFFLLNRAPLDFGGSVTNLASSTNKTSRDVKMERERIRMEKMREKSRLMNSSAETQRRLLLDDRLSVVAPPSPALTTSSSGNCKIIKMLC